MTTSIKVSVNGNYKIPVVQGETTTWVSGRREEGDPNSGPVEATFHPTHGDGATFQIGPEEPDDGHHGRTDQQDAADED